MPTKSYVIWNNKGGVGKSTITFHIASVFAEENPDKDVVVIDMCPQANASMMLLGGGKIGENHLQSLISEATPKTIVGFLTEKILKGDVINGKGASCEAARKCVMFPLENGSYSIFISKLLTYSRKILSGNA